MRVQNPQGHVTLQIIWQYKAKLLWECVVFVHRHQNRLINAKYTWRSLVFFLNLKQIWLGRIFHLSTCPCDLILWYTVAWAAMLIVSRLLPCPVYNLNSIQSLSPVPRFCSIFTLLGKRVSPLLVLKIIKITKKMCFFQILINI